MGNKLVDSFVTVFQPVSPTRRNSIAASLIRMCATPLACRLTTALRCAVADLDNEVGA